MMSKMRHAALLLSLVVAACGGAADSVATTSSVATATPNAPATASVSAPTQTTAPASAPNRQRVQVLSVADGDTIRVSIDGKSTPVRYIGIDTPETVDPRKSVQCFGKEASAFNASLVAGKVIELEKDVSETDKYARLLRYIWIDGKLVNEELVRGGYAKSSSYPPDVKYQDRFRAAEADARTRKVGLWADNACVTATPAPSTVAPTAPPASAALAVAITNSVYGAVSATTSPGASCTAQARLPSGSVSTAAGLAATQTANAGGSVGWTYRTVATTRAGTGTHTVTCTLAGVTRSASAPFTVK